MSSVVDGWYVIMEQWGNDTDREIPRYSDKTCLSAPLSNINPTQTRPSAAFESYMYPHFFSKSNFSELGCVCTIRFEGRKSLTVRPYRNANFVN
jgi:hypothetical protein